MRVKATYQLLLNRVDLPSAQRKHQIAVDQPM
jgi:hypothetical protein